MAAGQDGSTSMSTNGYTSKKKTHRKIATKKGRSVWWILTMILRLCIWYALLTPFLHCPSNISQLDDSSPRVCKPYLVARSHLEPHISPYYQIYAAPYLDAARPYAQTINDRVYIPASEFAKHSYHTYGAPALSHARKFGEKQWHEEVIPRLYAAQEAVGRIYVSHMNPYVQRILTAVEPYTVRVTHVNEKYLLPLFIHSKTFLGRTFAAGQETFTTTALPLAKRAWSSTVVFVNGAVWPMITSLYSENVEPQLVKIGERLASYREGQKLRSAVEEIDSISEQQGFFATSSLEEQDPLPQSTNSVTASVVPEPEHSLTPEGEKANIREQIASDLLAWQEKFAIAADNGVEDMSERIRGIATIQIDNGINKHGSSLLHALQTVVDHEISNVKIDIIRLIEALPEEYALEEEETASTDLISAIRKAGMTIRDKAHTLREWARSFEEELIRQVFAASVSTLAVLDEIRDLGLQEVGMRWAWMDGVTYRDWAKFHETRKQLHEWRMEVQETAMTHPKVEEARTAVNDLLSAGISVAEEAAKELTRLKKVGKWKIQARDSSENFETRLEPSAGHIEPFPESESDSTLEVNSGNQPTIPNSFITAKELLERTRSETEEQTTTAESTTSVTPPFDSQKTPGGDPVNEDFRNEEYTPSKPPSVTNVRGGVIAQAIPTNEPLMNDPSGDEYYNKLPDDIQDLAKQAEEQFAEAIKAVSEALLASLNISGDEERAISVSSEQYSRALAAASSALHSTAPNFSELFKSNAVDRYKAAVSAASSVIYSAASQPTPGPLELVSEIASSRLHEGLSFASTYYSSVIASVTPTPTALMDPVLLDAQRRYYEAIGHAHDHYSAFLSSASEIVYGIPTPTSTTGGFNDVLKDVDAEYSRISSLASSSLTAVVSSVSAAMATDTGSSLSNVLADASSRYSAAMLAASESLHASSPSASSINSSPIGGLDSAVSAVSEKWEDLISKASEQIYGAPTAHVQQLLHCQPAQYLALESLVSELIVGKESWFTESFMSRFRVAYETPYPLEAFSTSSLAGDAFATSSAYLAVSTPTTAPEEVLVVANEKLDSAIEATSVIVYDTSKGGYEHATAYESQPSAVSISSASSTASSAGQRSKDEL